MASAASRLGMFLLATVALLLLSQPATPISVIVRNGYEFHASLTSPSVDWVILGANVSACLPCHMGLWQLASCNNCRRARGWQWGEATIYCWCDMLNSFLACLAAVT